MSTTPAFQFDHAGLFAGFTVADESPMEPGVYLLPARSTLVEPPQPPDDKWPRWNGTRWELINRPQLTADNDNDPVAKLRAFLAANPDVAALLQQGGV